jgi:hypothetical protein
LKAPREDRADWESHKYDYGEKDACSAEHGQKL